MMRTMKKILCFVLLLALCIQMTACASSGGGLGTLTMDEKTPVSSGSLPPLGQSDSTSSAPPQPESPVETAPAEGTPVPQTTPAPQQPAPSTGTLTVEQYNGPEFSMKIPSGWQVISMPIAQEDGTKTLLAVVYDPANPNNRMWHATAIEPFFFSESDKQAWLNAGIPDYYRNAPVLTDVSASGLVQNWGGVYAVMQAQGYDKYFTNYTVDQVASANILQQEGRSVASDVLCMATIPGDSNPYVLYLTNVLAPVQGAQGLPDFLRSGPNFSLMVTYQLCQSDMQTLVDCLSSFTLAGNGGTAAAPSFDGKYVPDIEIDLSLLP